MNYTLRIEPTTSDPSAVLEALHQIFGADERARAKQVARRGGVIYSGPDEQVARRFETLLRRAGARVVIEREAPPPVRPPLVVRVEDAADDAPLAGARVTLYPPTDPQAPLAAATTDDDGIARVPDFAVIAEARFGDQRPKVAARVEHEGRGAKVRYAPFDWVAFEGGGYVFRVSATIAASAGEAVVRGRVYTAEGEPARGVRVGVEDRDLRGRTPLGVASTNDAGHYVVRYDHARWQADERGRADLVLSVSDSTGRPLAARITGRELPEIAGEQIIFDAEADEEVDLKLAEAAQPVKPSRYAHLVAAVTPLPAGVTLGELSDDDVRFLHHETKLPLAELAFVRDDVRLGRALGLPAGALFGWATAGIGVVDADADVPRVEWRAVLDAPTKRLIDALDDAIERRRIPAALRDDSGRLRRRIDAARAARAARSSVDGLAALRRAADQGRPAEADDAAPPAALLKERAVAALRTQLDEVFGPAPEAARRAVAAIDLRALDPSTPLRSTVEAALARLPSEAAREARTRLSDARLPASLDEVLRPELPLAEHPLLADDLRRARLLDVGAAAGLARERMLDLLGEPGERAVLSEAQLERWVADERLAADEARALGLAHDLDALVGGDTALADAIGRAKFDALDGRRVASTRDLARLSSKALASVVRAARGDGEGSESVDAVARRLAQRFEYLHPDEAVFGRGLTVVDRPRTAAALERVAELEEGVGAAIDPAARRPRGLSDADGAAVAHLRGLAAAFGPLGVAEVLTDGARTPTERARAVAARLDVFERFRAQNADADLLALDLAGAELDALDWSGVDDEMRRPIRETLAVVQRVYALARSAPLTEVLLRAGHHSALAIAGMPVERFARDTGLAIDVAGSIHGRARRSSGAATALFASVVDLVRGGFQDIRLGNLGPSIHDYLTGLDGYEDLFGSLDFCACAHCQSILGPAAYFVDLMHFVETHVLAEYFDDDGIDDPLDLAVRRPDLWSLELTCANTNTLVSTLRIIVEVLENYIATRGRYAGSLAVGPDVDRSGVEGFVYGERLAGAVASMRQPFVRPLRELEVYLEHFDLTRGQIARAIGVTDAVGARAELGLSLVEHAQLTRPRVALARLGQLFGVDFVADGAVVEAFDAQQLVRATGHSRAELDALIGAAFIVGGDAHPIRIQSEKRDGESVQNDIERVRDATPAALDRMHRFIRLWRRVPWSIRELDVVVEHLIAAGFSGALDEALVIAVARLRRLQQALEVPVDELVALWAPLPTRPTAPEGEALFDRRFNPTGSTADADRYPPEPAEAFVHPALLAGADTRHLDRLLAGLGTSDEDLYALIVQLADPLGVDLDGADAAALGFTLSGDNLALLYRHARLAEHLGLSVDALFQLIGVLDVPPAGHVGGLDDLIALVEGRARQAASPYSLDTLGRITGGRVLDRSAQIDPAAVAAAMVEAVARDGALAFADTALAYLDGVSEADARAILAANPTLVEPVGTTGLLRVTDDADLDAAIALPEQVEATEDEVRGALRAYRPSAVIPAYLAAELAQPVDKVAATLALAGVDLNTAELAAALRGGDSAPLVALVDDLTPLALLLAPPTLGAADVAFIAAEGDHFDLADPAAPTIETAWRIAAYHRLLAAGDATETARRAALHTALTAHDPASGFAATATSALATLLDAEVGVLTAFEGLDRAAPAVHALERLATGVALGRRLGVGGPTLGRIAAEDYDALTEARNTVRSAIRARHDDEASWQATIELVDERVLSLRRDALVDELVSSRHLEFATPTDLYRYFLLDVQLDACARTSRVVEATASVQLYVHRCLMNLEQDRRAEGDRRRTHVRPQSIPADEWAWRKNYRVWEANRKVFLYPETYLEPELRDDKTPLFEALESTLLQQPIDAQAVLDTYAEYVRGFEELARLRVAGAWHDEGAETDVLHLFGATADEPPRYYHRTIEGLIVSESDPDRGVVYGPWRPLDVQIPVERVSPVIHRGTLYLFWVEITTRPITDFEEGASRFKGYHHTFAIRYTTRRLDGRWTTPQTLRTQGPPLGKGVLIDPQKVIYLDGGPRVVAQYGDWRTEHREPVDGYTLMGSRWNRVFPDVHEADGTLYLTGVGYMMHSAVDPYTRTLGWRDGSVVDGAVQWTGAIERGKLVTTRQRYHDEPWGLYLGTPERHVFDDYAFASLVADHRRIDEAATNWTNSLVTEVRQDLYRVPLARMPEPTDIIVVNGAVSDALIDIDGDLLYVQGSARDGERALVRRMGTTLAGDIGRALVTDGIGGLLDLDAQRAFREAASPLTMRQAALSDGVNADTLDFEGPYGTYYRELFFHVPFLIADHLNSQQQYAEAQRWYHYLFDPTAPIEEPAAGESAEDAARDRPWRYLEFRGLDAERLRERLTHPGAIAAYERDPFNPHAIARLRLTAYQKAVVMKYVDNLLDWGDALFTRDTREAITEATMLYTTAADILGERPAKLGSCGEGTVTPKSYEAIRPHLEAGSPFLIEIERLIRRAVTRAPASIKKQGEFTVGLAAIRDSRREADRIEHALHGGREPIRRSAAPVEPPPLGEGIPISAGVAAPVVDRAPAQSKADGIAFRPVYRADWSKAAIRADITRWLDGVEVNPGSKLGGAWHKDIPTLGASLARQISPVFCVPDNAELGAYWDRVEDRLYKIRHCMNIKGIRRQLALFAPPIDPRLLVRARAAGLSIEDALGLSAGELPPYRFEALIGRAKAHAQTVQGFGAALLAALERKDGEELGRLRQLHQQNLARLVTQTREQEVEAAARALEALNQRKAAVEYRRAYFEGLIESGRSRWERTQAITLHAANILKGLSGVLDTAAGIGHLIPQIGAPTSMKWGGAEMGRSADSWSGASRDAASALDGASCSAGFEARLERRAQGWKHQIELAARELDQLEAQIEGAEIRLEITRHQLVAHQRQSAQLDEVFEFYGEKFTGLGLYTWLSSTLQRLHREAYNSALSMARLAEQALRFERPDLVDAALSPSHWDAGRAGLLAGQQLYVELQRMERRYIETDDRRIEVDQSFSLQQIDPGALITLQETGGCTFTLPERYFDLFYPGQYRRMIKAARVTLPCVAGPYTNVSATLSLLGSHVRLAPDATAPLTPSPASRTTTIATSSAQNDAGVFDLSFRGERYLPFEGAGAVESTWQLTLPRAFRPLDYRSITDVILRLSYVADIDGALGAHVETEDSTLAGTLAHGLSAGEGRGLVAAIRMRTALSTMFFRLLRARVGERVSFELTDQHFPLFVRDRGLTIRRARLLVVPAGGSALDGFEIAIDDEVIDTFAAQPDIGGLPGSSVDTIFEADPRGAYTLALRALGGLTAGTGETLDENLLEDLILYLEYGATMR